MVSPPDIGTLVHKVNHWQLAGEDLKYESTIIRHFQYGKCGSRRLLQILCTLPQNFVGSSSVQSALITSPIEVALETAGTVGHSPPPWETSSCSLLPASQRQLEKLENWSFVNCSSQCGRGHVYCIHRNSKQGHHNFKRRFTKMSHL